MKSKLFVAPFGYLPKQHCPVCEFIILPSFTWQQHPHPENPIGITWFLRFNPSNSLLGEGFGSLGIVPGYGFDLACSKVVESVCPQSSLTSPSRRPNATTPHSWKRMERVPQHLFPTISGYQHKMELLRDTQKHKQISIILKSGQILRSFLDVF